MNRVVGALTLVATLGMAGCGVANGYNDPPITTEGRFLIHLPSIPPGAHIAVQAHIDTPSLVTTALRFRASIDGHTAQYTRWYPWHGLPIQLTWSQLWGGKPPSSESGPSEPQAG